LAKWDDLPQIELLVIAVGHKAYAEMELDKLLVKLKPGGVVLDVKSVLSKEAVRAKGFILWRL
ncbi:MAG: nucleotide sugar dehydrogenase, partial [Burkholderiales bacterium]